MLVALKSDFRDLLDGPNLACFSYECAVNIELPPAEFETRCKHCFSVHDSLETLEQLGYRLPSQLPDIGALTIALTQSPRMQGERTTKLFWIQRLRRRFSGKSSVSRRKLKLIQHLVMRSPCPRMPLEDIVRYVEQCRQMQEGG